MNLNEIQKFINLLSARIHLYDNYFTFSNSSKKLLVVEGSTDKRFLDKSNYLNNDVRCIIANDAFGSGNGLSSQNKIIYKNAIVFVVYGLSKIPALINYPDCLKNCAVYGMVDMDFDIAAQYTQNNCLFITDTHDLETLMLSTDSNLLQGIEELSITHENVKLAFFMAYELGMIKRILSEKGITTQPLSNELSFDYFFNRNHLISFPNVMSFINSISKSFSPSTLKKKNDEILKKNKKLFDENGLWRHPFSNTKPLPKDFWSISNGHDILNLLRYIRPDLSSILHSFSGAGLNRSFEIKLIDKYNYKAFKTTKLYEKMKREKIVI